jgi:hypothetical protein
MTLYAAVIQKHERNIMRRTAQKGSLWARKRPNIAIAPLAST